jgi:hypothetical protein
MFASADLRMFIQACARNAANTTGLSLPALTADSVRCSIRDWGAQLEHAWVYMKLCHQLPDVQALVQ